MSDDSEPEFEEDCATDRKKYLYPNNPGVTLPPNGHPGQRKDETSPNNAETHAMMRLRPVMPRHMTMKLKAEVNEK